MEAPASRLIALVGPTASGKSALALRLARERTGEIVSCDSLQVYRGLDIGSAKASPEERALVPHHLIDVADAGEPFSAAQYASLARASLRDIAARGALPIVAGGSGLYLKALIEGLFAGPSRDERLRQRLTVIAARHGDERLHRLLARVDPVAAASIPTRDRVRVVRALEVYRLTRRPISEQQRGPAVPLAGFRVLTLGLAPDRERLRALVIERTRLMLERGLLDEVRALMAGGLAPEERPLQAIGYRQAVAVLQGRLSLAEAEHGIVTDTMRYAKRQMTWFRHQTSVAWCPDPDSAHACASAWLDREAG